MNTQTNLRAVYQRIDLKQCTISELQKMFTIYLKNGMEDIANEIAEYLYLNTDASGTIITPVPDLPPVTIAEDLPWWIRKFPFNLLWSQRPRS